YLRSSIALAMRSGAALMIFSWALVEVPRYLFYVAAIVTGDATKGTPYPLFWLRYSLFAWCSSK
ncbi:protein tyrosine phosphatase-like domain-containing protein, partial [Klebsiella aerogenes]|uniref:protein tyrosine phosphatase-like domain-containing protein n=1 Tax=Klebsiella aerogenes TaxID=548 RepID=UPI0019544946